MPNGIPQDPSENRKAIHVEDHPLAYIDFEGEIPAGSYGAGRVSIWDTGLYECERRQEDKLIVSFYGERLRGRYALFRAGEERDWLIHRMDPPAGRWTKMPEHLPPMLATSGSLPAGGEERWAFEVKWDGVRAITYWHPGRMRIESRNLNDVSASYPELRPLGAQLGAREAILDGEIVAFDEQGHPSFERLQTRMHLSSASAIRRLARTAPVTYVIFDLLYLDGELTTQLPYRERRSLLRELALNGPTWRTPPSHDGAARDFFEVTAAHGLEGVIAKLLTAPYRVGERSGEWLKIKHRNRQELVIGGWLVGKGARSGQIGALLMGYYEQVGRRLALRYAGRVGTGFDEAELERLAGELRARRRRTSPFAKSGVQPPPDANFVKPELVAEVEFSRWTRDRILLHSVYRGLRADKDVREVQLERPPTPHAASGARSAASAAHASASGEREPGSTGEPYEVRGRVGRHTEVEAQGRTLRLSNREKILYPETGFSKGELIDYYAAIAPALLPHLAGRPLTLKRYPDGVEQQHFYEKRCPAHRPPWVRTAAVWSERHEEQIDYCVVEDLPSLIWVANLASIELHPSLARADDQQTPTALVFDLDPGPPAGLRECCRVALALAEIFAAFELSTLVKSSGAKGLQVYVPLNTPATYEQSKPFARAVAELLEKRHPKLVVSRMTKHLRAGRVLIDWSQNDPHKTTVCVYSLRAGARPLVSTPLTWEEVRHAARRRSEPRLSEEPAALLRRVEREGDSFAGLLGSTQALPDLRTASAPVKPSTKARASSRPRRSR